MHRVQELIRLHRLGLSRRRIARRLGMGRDTIRDHYELLARAALLDGPADQLPGLDELGTVIGSAHAAPVLESSVAVWRPAIAKLHKEGCGPTAIHDHLRLQVPDYNGSLSAVKRMCLRLDRERGPQASEVAIRVETVPGEVAQVDFGYAGMRYAPVRGVLRKS